MIEVQLTEEIKFINANNMDVMSMYPDDYFDIAIVDPEYGIGASEMTMGSGKNKKWSKGKKWDAKPPEEKYFKELLRVSKNQIIWGGNYFTDKLKVTRGWIFWDKGINGDCSFADGELAWTSLDVVLRKADIRYKGFLGADNVRIHPTQKLIPLYYWLLENYTKKGQKILDSHLGSASHAIAAHYYGVGEFVGIELDEEYFNASVERFKDHINMFPKEGQKATTGEQTNIFQNL